MLLCGEGPRRMVSGVASQNVCEWDAITAFPNLCPSTAMIKQFLSDVVWGPLDYLLVDTPPGTSDEHISVVEGLRTLNPDGAILVTTPQVSSAHPLELQHHCKCLL